MVEDVALVRYLAGRVGAVAMLDGADLLTTRMYDDARSAWRGWGRSLALPGVEPRRRQWIDLAVVLLAQALPLPRLLAGRGDLLDVVLLARSGSARWSAPQAYERRGVAYWSSPVADVLATAAFARGIVSPRQPWRGRTYSIRR